MASMTPVVIMAGVVPVAGVTAMSLAARMSTVLVVVRMPVSTRMAVVIRVPDGTRMTLVVRVIVRPLSRGGAGRLFDGGVLVLSVRRGRAAVVRRTHENSSIVMDGGADAPIIYPMGVSNQPSRPPPILTPPRTARRRSPVCDNRDDPEPTRTDLMRLITLAAVLALAIAGCAAPQQTRSASDGDLLSSFGLDGMSTEEVIAHLETMPVDERPQDLLASVQQEHLALTGPDDEVALDMPEDSTYLSIAPYVDSTHECFYHSLTTCLGELDSAPVDVTITDDATGDVIVDTELTTEDNGFVGLWVPRGIAGTIEVAHDGRSGSTTFSTEADGATCITTLRLEE